MRYLVLLRGINVGGRNLVPMAQLKTQLSRSFGNVETYIQSGNVLLDADLSAAELSARIEQELPATFRLDSDLVRVLVFDPATYREVIAAAPAGFGSDPDTYRYDVAFYLGIRAADVEPYLTLHPDVDDVHLGERAFYHRRLTAQATRSRVARKLLGSPVYPSLTIRNWRTTATLAERLGLPED